MLKSVHELINFSACRLVVFRGVSIIGTADISAIDMLNFTVSVIGTDN